MAEAETIPLSSPSSLSFSLWSLVRLGKKETPQRNTGENAVAGGGVTVSASSSDTILPRGYDDDDDDDVMVTWSIRLCGQLSTAQSALESVNDGSG